MLLRARGYTWKCDWACYCIGLVSRWSELVSVSTRQSPHQLQLSRSDSKSESKLLLLCDYGNVALLRHSDQREANSEPAADPGQPLAVNLPVNILETVFAHLSVQDMMNCSLVCTRWSTICRREKVCQWVTCDSSLVLIILYSSCFGRWVTWD